MSLTSPTELIARSKQKYALAQARLRRGMLELALLSLHGSLEDALRSYLLLYQHPASQADWSSLVAALQVDAQTPLTAEQAERMQDMHQLWSRIIAGEAVNLAAASAQDYQQFVAALMVRYGVLVVAPEPGPRSSELVQQLVAEQGAGGGFAARRSRRPLTTLLAVVLVCVVLLLVAPLVLNRQSSLGSTLAAFPEMLPFVSDTSPAAGEPGTVRAPTVPPADALFPGRTAYVRGEDEDALALRDRPGTASNNPIRIYLSPDTAVQLIDGPVRVNGQEWWQVRAANYEGWCRAEFLEIR